MRKTPSKPRSGAVRCAVYTRKSHEEGLEQDFNSLDAQREACEAYILSQKHEGWVCLPEMYDDGGISGATMDRPALKRLLDDIEAGCVDTVVVYKVDRLTRSLGDFAKIVEVFDRRNVSFVSVTQQFNTTTSMGRLTLNMLLSFAQFEREVTGERIRDKIAASKKKGMWMGGLPPLGYDVKDRKLVVNETEAETVRHIFRRYAELGSVWDLKDDLDRDGILSKLRTDRFGRISGGKPLARGALYAMLQNRIYLGEIVHKENSYPGEHDAIVDEPLWDTVQQTLTANRIDHERGANAAQPSLLAGLVFDETGEGMTPTHASKKGTRYRYYVSRKLIQEGRRHAPRARRIPAADLETLVEDRLLQFLSNTTSVFEAIEGHVTDANRRADIATRATALAGRWKALPPTEKRSILLSLVERIDVLRDSLEIRIQPGRLPKILGDENERHEWTDPDDDGGRSLTLTIPVRLKRAGMENRLLIEGNDKDARRKPDHSLHRTLAQAQQYRAMVMHSGGKSMSELAAEAGVVRSYFTRVLRLAFLAPDIVSKILRDDHPVDLTANRLAKEIRIPISWEDQRACLGVE